MKIRSKQLKGFTLVEMLVVVAIISILAMVAYPGYQQYVLRTNRSEAHALLNDAAARQERFFAQNNVYATTAAALGYASDMSASNLYQLTIANPTAASYTLTAISQRTDETCGNLTLSEAGARGQTGTGGVDRCWK